MYPKIARGKLSRSMDFIKWLHLSNFQKKILVFNGFTLNRRLFCKSLPIKISPFSYNNRQPFSDKTNNHKKGTYNLNLRISSWTIFELQMFTIMICNLVSTFYICDFFILSVTYSYKKAKKLVFFTFYQYSKIIHSVYIKKFLLVGRCHSS